MSSINLFQSLSATAHIDLEQAHRTIELLKEQHSSSLVKEVTLQYEQRLSLDGYHGPSHW